MVYAIIVCNAVALSAPVSFLPAMVERRFHVDKDVEGNAVGVLIGAFSLTQFGSSFFVGHLSDKWGRRPLLLLGIGACFVLLGVFGLSTTIWIAIGNRLLEGALNSNIPVAKAYLSDITPNPEHRAVAFAYMGAAFGFARVVASAASGLLVAAMPRGHSLEFAVPCFVLSAPLLAVFVSTAWLLPESRPLGKLGHARGNPCGDLWKGLKEVAANPVMRVLVVMYGVNSFGNGTTLLLFTLTLSLSVTEGGLGMEPIGIGIAFSVFGAAALAFQVAFFRRILHRLGVRRVHRYVGSLCLAGGVILLPASSLPLGGDPDASTARVAAAWACCYLCLSLCAAGFMTLLPMVNTMLAHAADQEKQGLSQGAAQSVASLLRGLGPITAGFVFTVGVKAGAPWLVHALVAASYIGVALLSCTLPASVEGHQAPETPGGEDGDDSDWEGDDEEKGEDEVEGEDIELTSAVAQHRTAL